MRKEDFFPLMRLIYEIFPDRYNPNLFLSLYELFPDGFLIAEEYGNIIGFIIGVKPSIDKGKILLIGVDKRRRRKGIGSMLLKKLIIVFMIKGIREIELEVRASNAAAIRFYEKHGFRIASREHAYYEDGEDAYIMVKSL